MARGFGGYPRGGGNMNNMMKQIEKLQKEMADMQENLKMKKFLLHLVEEQLPLLLMAIKKLYL